MRRYAALGQNDKAILSLGGDCTATHEILRRHAPQNDSLVLRGMTVSGGVTLKLLCNNEQF